MKPAESKASGAWEERAFLPALALLMLATLFCRTEGLNPLSLWYDDIWVALAGMAANPMDLLSYTRSTPIGFTILVALFVKGVPDPEVSAQLPALLFSLALLPLGACFVRRVTGNVWLGLLAAVFLACSPTIALYSLRVKQFTCDAFCSLLILWMALPALEKPDTARPFRNLSLTAAVLTLFSYVSFFVSFVTVNWLLLERLRTRRFQWKTCRQHLTWAAAFNGFFGLMFLLLYSRQRHGKLVDSWEDKVAFIPLGSDWPVLRSYFLDGVLGKAVYGAFEIIETAPVPHIYFVLFLVVAGWLSLMLKTTTRVLGTLFSLVFLQALVLSALRLYPLGWGRVDIYLHTLILLLAAFGCGLVFRPLWSKPLFSRLCPVFLAAVFLWRAPGIGQKGVTYHEFQYNLDYLKKAEIEWKADESSILLLNQDGAYPAVYYMDWNLEISPKKVARGMRITSHEPRLIIPEEPDGYRDNLDSLDDNLQEILPLLPGKIIILHEKESESVSYHMRDFYLKNGYAQGIERSRPGVFLTVLEKKTRKTESQPGQGPLRQAAPVPRRDKNRRLR